MFPIYLYYFKFILFSVRVYLFVCACYSYDKKGLKYFQNQKYELKFFEDYLKGCYLCERYKTKNIILFLNGF